MARRDPKSKVERQELNEDYMTPQTLKTDSKSLFQFRYAPKALQEKELTNSKMATFMLAVESISQQANVEDINSLYNCFNQYVALCSQADMRITNQTAYRACGVSRNTIESWISGYRRANQPEYRKFAEMVKGICSSYREQLGIEGKLNPVAVIWWQKAHDGMRDDFVSNEITEEKKNNTAEELFKKYETL